MNDKIVSFNHGLFSLANVRLKAWCYIGLF